MFHLRVTAKFYASEIIICFQYFHNHNIVYRDLKPENLLVDITGHIKFIDFGFAKEIEHRSWSLCGTPEYLAPEIVTGRGHGKGVDWWALGIIIYEMIAGKSPFVNENEMQMYRNIVMVEYEMPFHFSRSVRKIISALLEKSPPHRLGCLKDGAEDIKKTAWLKKVRPTTKCSTTMTINYKRSPSCSSKCNPSIVQSPPKTD